MKTPKNIVTKNCVDYRNLSVKTPSGKNEKLRIMNSLMDITGIYNLLQEEDLYIFFKRICLVFNDYKILDNFFIKDELITVKMDSNEIYTPNITITTYDCIAFYGAYRMFEQINETEKEWLYKLPQLKEEIKEKRFYKWIQNIKSATHSPELKISFEETEFINAEIAASSLIKNIPPSVFRKWEKKNERKIKSHQHIKRMAENERRFNLFLLKEYEKVTCTIAETNNLTAFDTEQLVKWYWLYCNDGLMYDLDTGELHIHPVYHITLDKSHQLFTEANEKELIELFNLNILNFYWPEHFEIKTL